MKVLILNSGIGSRMGTLTEKSPKCLVNIIDDTTILDNQLQIISTSGIKDVVITTGPFGNMIEDYINDRYPQLHIKYVKNEIYNTTNYIFSIVLAKELLHDDIILMHGDLVFNDSVFYNIINCENSSMVINKLIPLPEKDFKAEIINERIVKVSIDSFTNAVAALPLYKINKSDWGLWLEKMIEDCSQGLTKVYAEYSLNQILDKFELKGFDIGENICGEVDTLDDLNHMRELLERKELK